VVAYVKCQQTLDTRDNYKIDSYIRNDPQLKIFQEQSNIFGKSQFKIDFSFLVNWFLYRAKNVGSKQMAQELQKFISSEFIVIKICTII
jgi:hypothetical protein